MTAPNYTDKDRVLGFTRKDLVGLIAGKIVSKRTLAQAALELWDARDSARATAALQDEAIHKALPRTHALEVDRNRYRKALEEIMEQVEGTVHAPIHTCKNVYGIVDVALAPEAKS